MLTVQYKYEKRQEVAVVHVSPYFSNTNYLALSSLIKRSDVTATSVVCPITHIEHLYFEKCS